MNTTKKLLASAVAASALTMTMASAQAEVEVAASAGIASSYHWRGFDLGSGSPAFSGDLVASVNGFYGGMWASSGDLTGGTEYDLFFGYGGEVGDFSYDVSYISYIYPTSQFEENEGPGDFAEVILNLGYGPVGFFVHTNVAGASTDGDDGNRYAFYEGEYMYYGVSAEAGDFSFVLAKHDEKDADGESVDEDNPGVTGNLMHLDATYAYNDNLAFTLSIPLSSEFENDDAEEDGSDGEPSPKFVVSYSIPFE